MGDFYNRGGGSLILTDLEVDGTTVVVDETNDRVGIGTAAPGTQLQVESNAPYVTLKNDTAENSAAGCESKIIFEDHGNNALGQLEVSHVGTADDEKGQLILSTNNDSGLQTALTISEAQLATFAGSVAVTVDLAVDGVANLDNTDIDGTFTMDGATFDVNATGAVTVDGTTLSLDGTDSTNLTMTANSSSAKALTIDAVNSGSGVASITLGTTSGTAVSIGHTTSETTVNDNLTVTGDLTVNGTTTTINSTTLTVDDLLIEVASGAADSNAANGAGISIDGADATITYAHTGTKFVMNKPLDVTGAISATSDMSIAASKAYKVGSTAILSDSSGTMTLSNIDALDATTEATIEAAIDTLSNLTTVGTIGTGTWEATDIAVAHGGTGASNATNARTALGVVIGTNVQAYDADLTALSSCQTGGAAALALLTATEVAILDGATLSTAELNYVDGVTSAIQTQINTKGATAGSASITTVGTIATGTWNATVIASAKLDADTAHLTTTQTFTGAKTFSADTTFGVDDTGVDVRLFSATASEGVLYDASEDELALLLTTKLKFHDVGGGEEIFASEDGTLKVNAGAILDETAPIIDLNAATKIIVNSPIMQMFSGTSARPLMSLECTNPDALGGTLQFVKDGASVADNDVVGTIKFVSEDDTGDPGPLVQTYATIESTISDMTAGSEGGSISISVASHDGELQPGLTLQDGNAEDEIDVFIANGAASVTTVAGLLSVTSGVALEEASSLEIIAPLLPTNDHASSGIIALMLAGGAIAAFQTVCAHTTTGEVVITDSNAIATMPVIGIAPVAISDTATGPIMLQGFIRDDTWTWTIGGIMYASETAGAMTQTAPTTSGAFVQALGVAISADVVYFNPSLTLVEVA
mgnify:FL=1